jgi:amino acid adenylation domain-containing protein
MAPTQEMSGAKRRLLEKMLRGQAARQSWQAPLAPRPAGTPVPIAPAQNLVWLSAQMTASEPVYNEPITIHYRGELNRRALERALNEVIRRQEILRTTFAQAGNEVVQAIHENVTIPIPYVDLSGLPQAEREQEAQRTAVADARRLFDLSVGPLIRARLVKMEENYHRLYFTMHHILFDGVSIYSGLVPELAAIYTAFAAGEPSPLPEPKYQYADFALWQKQMLDNQVAAAQVEYWRGQLSGELPELELPVDRPRPAVHSYRGGMKVFQLSADLTAAVKATALAEGATPYMVLLAGFKALLHRYSGQEDILVGGVSDARRRPEFTTMIGHFLNFLALRTRPEAAMTFREYLGQVRDTVLGALANSDVPFDHLVRELHPKRESARRPFFQVTFSIEPPAAEAAPGWDLTQMDAATGVTKLDLYLEMDERPEGYVARFIYSTDIFDAATIDRMTGHWLTLLEAAIGNPAARLGDLAMLTEAEQRQLRFDWNNTAREIPAVTVNQMVEQQAALTPNAIALEASGERLTYRELNERANRLAHCLRRKGVTPGSLVALCVDRTADLIIAPLAVLKAGAAYLPLDPSFPKDRLAYIMEDAQAPVLLTARSLEGRLPRARRVVFSDEADAAAGNLEALSTPESLAYVRYTSGSTGRPKGVEIHHRALVNLLRSMQREPGFTASDALLAVTTFSFDISELELFLPLIAGGRVVVASREEARDPRRLMERLRESRCNVLQATPAAWRGLIEAGWSGQKNLRALCGGEALPRDLAEQLMPRVAELWNVYGPTETTVWSAVHRVSQEAGPVAIGHPIDNTQVYILDKQAKLAPVGVVGELAIGGAGVSRGYLRREELTAERFVPHPFEAGEKVYLTGDLARWRPDGVLECLGRIDNQVKIRGFRIELGEIEAALLDHEDVREAAVRVWPDASGNLSMAAYVAGSEGLARPDLLRNFLEQKLPEYMIPARFVKLDALPLTPNGKVDRNALPEPAEMNPGVAFVAPRNEMERRLAAIFESVLESGPVGVQESFFDLGGHSFLVSRLLRRVEAEFGHRLSMGAVFEAPTVERLAAAIQDKAPLARLRHTVMLQPAGSREPLIWIHGGPLFRPLANRLGTGRPFLGVAFDPAEDLSGRTLPELAATLVETIRAAQPQGPYVLGGWCISGLLAYEAAAQLIAAGERVSLVVMLDSLNPTHFRQIPQYRLTASKAVFHLKRLLNKAPGDLFSYGKKHTKGFVTQMRDRSLDGEGSAMESAALAYDPPPISAPVLHIEPAERPSVRDLRASWAKFLAAGNLEIRDVPGDHISSLMEPHVGAIAKAINRKLQDNVVEMRTAAVG